ncbi:flagellar export chaperone FlgN [Desulforhabdus amnigena]|nr:flagellar export chaperone FlgN [Desulforhabdus amnigena]NLJ27634.1 flagellar protein FlgN [Deltaproteobacteria bacterium]
MSHDNRSCLNVSDPESSNVSEFQSSLLEAFSKTVQSLMRILHEEFEALKHFQSDRLLELLPEKEFLIQRMTQMLGELERIGEEDTTLGESESVKTFMGNLLEIERMNRMNHVLVEGSLEYCREYLNVLVGGSYSGNNSNPLSKMSLKGLRVSREI